MRAALYHRSAHVPDSKLSPPVTACVICGLPFANRPIAQIQQSPDVFLLHCIQCHACTASRIPTVDTLEDYYSGYFEQSGPKITHDSPARFARHISAFICAKQEKRSITDFGGGDGTLGYSLARILCQHSCSSVDVTVVDYPEPRISRDERIRVLQVHPGSPMLPSDIVLASAVLEHLPDPLTALKQLFAALEPSGILYARTPAVAGFMKLATACRQHLDFTFPAHLHDFGQRFWENILSLIPGGSEFEILHSAPSLVETDFRRHPWLTLAAHVAKAPWQVLGRRYDLVGGWEIVFRRR